MKMSERTIKMVFFDIITFGGNVVYFLKITKRKQKGGTKLYEIAEFM